MANIQTRTDQTGNTRYRVQIRLKGYPAQTATFDRLTDARKWAASTESAIREGRHFKTAEAKKHTLADVVDRYRRDILPRKKASTAKDNDRHLRWWREQIGAYVLADVTAALIVEHRDALASGTFSYHRSQSIRKRNPATANRYLASLSHALSVAEREWGWIESNPCRKVSKLKESRGRVRFLSDEERTRLLEVCKNSPVFDLYPAIMLALSTGARRMEALSIRWGDVDLKRGFVTLHDTKNGDPRTVPLVGPTHELLRQRSKIRRIDTDYVFPAPTNPNKPAEFRRGWEQAVEDAGIEDFRFHDLRHSCASYLAMNGASLAEIAEVLGHKTLAMVKRYAHIHPEHMRGVMERMSNAVFGEFSR